MIKKEHTTWNEMGVGTFGQMCIKLLKQRKWIQRKYRDSLAANGQRSRENSFDDERLNVFLCGKTKPLFDLASNNHNNNVQANDVSSFDSSSLLPASRLTSLKITVIYDANSWREKKRN